jgi:signal transduction histidine kinase
MSVGSITLVLQNSVKDEALVKHFLRVWPDVTSILEAFSKATQLPIFAYLYGSQVFQSSMQTMPPFCTIMLNSDEMRPRCIEDGRKRAEKVEPEVGKVPGIQLCHAGMANGRREINTGVGTLVILFGSRKATTEPALLRREKVIKAAFEKNPELAASLRKADAEDANVGSIDAPDTALMDAISEIIQRLITATVGFRSLTINMAHELTNIMMGMGLFMREMEYLVNAYNKTPDDEDVTSQLLNDQSLIYTESRLGLYIVRNFLSHTSESRYNEVVKPKFGSVDLNGILLDMVSLHRRHAASKHITLDTSGLEKLPIINGSEFEIRRLFHNVISNAIKYSYHSVEHARRIIKFKSKVPYDPGFHRLRFSITVENYGLGVSDEERKNVFKPGFRGKQAIAEVPIGAGIGLSEAQKIVKSHNGIIRLRSKELYEDATGSRTYLTTVEMIFPYKADKSFA